MCTSFLVFFSHIEFILIQCSDKLGLSLELGSFAAGVMISTTDLSQHTLEQVSFSIFYVVCVMWC